MDPTRTRPPTRRPLPGLALAALALAGACDRDPPTGPSQRPGPPTGQAVPPRQGVPSVPPGRGARVVVDVSESNRGFTSASSAALATLHHQVIEASLSAFHLNNPFQRCSLDQDIHCTNPPITAEQLRSPQTYAGRSAALHRALRRPPRAPRPDLQEPDPLDPWAVTVLVTDGFDSSNAAFQPSVSEDVACTAGADPSCMAALLRRRVDEGYGVWVIGLQMPFDGRYFTERRLDAAMWARVTAHVAELNRAPEWNGVRFTASAPNLRSEAGSFRFTGARPLLVFVLTRQIPVGRLFVADVVRRLNVERITIRHGAQDVAASEWAPFEGVTAMVTGAVRADQGGQADEVLVGRMTRAPSGAVVPASCSIQGKSRIRLTGSVGFGAVPPPPFARVDLGWRLIAPQGAQEVLVPREAMRAAPGPFAVHTGIDCTVLRSGQYGYQLGLWARWALNPQALSNEWYMRLNGDTTFETPERVFGLGNLGGTVVAAGVARQGDLDRVSLQVTRR